MRFCRCLRGELYRVFHTPTFLLVLLLLSALALVDGILAYREYRQNLENALTTIPMGENGAFQELPFLQTTTLYNSWIGGHPNSVAGLIFIYACPVYVSLAYSWTYLSEEQNGYARILVAKVGNGPIIFASILRCFLPGLSPHCFPCWSACCCLPALFPRTGQVWKWRSITRWAPQACCATCIFPIPWPPPCAMWGRSLFLRGCGPPCLWQSPTS